MSDWFHLIEGVAIAGLGAWIAWIQRRGAKIHELEIRLVQAETRIEQHGDGIEKLQNAVEDIREHMARREDVERLLQALKH